MKFKMKIKNGGPTALVAGGFVITAAGIVLACKKTIKMKQIADEAKEEKEDLKESLSVVNPEDIEYTEKDYKKDIRHLYIKTGLETIKTYYLPVSLIGVGFGMIGLGYGIKCKRYTALSAAHASFISATEAYRERVREKVGEEEEYKLYHNIKTEETKESGKKKKTKKDVMVNPELFDFIFDDTTAPTYAHGDAEYNDETQDWTGYDIHLIDTAYKAANGRCRNNSYLFVNDLRKMLQMEPIVDGQNWGWIIKSEEDKHNDPVKMDLYVAMNANGEPTLGVAIEPEYIIDKLKD